MADIFLSYANEDREVARKLSRLLVHAGWTVWWDRRIPAGSTWRKMLESALRDMRCMVVLWSSHSVESDWVKEEAEEARLRKKLMPVLIEKVNPPVGFRTIQAADLTDWDGAGESLGVRQLIADLELLIGKPASRAAMEPKQRIPPRQNANQTRSEVRSAGLVTVKERTERPTNLNRSASKINAAGWKVVAAGGVALVLALGVFALWRAREPGKERVAAIETPATPESPAASNVVKLGVHALRQELAPRETLGLTLRGQLSDGSENEITSGIEWSSSNPRVASVDAEGRVTAAQPGTTNITAAHDGLSSSSWTLTVKAAEVKPDPAPRLTALTVDANKQDLAPQERATLHVTGNYSDGSTKSLADGLVWLNSDTTVVSVDSKGELRALQPGAVEIMARAGGVTSAPLRLVVKEPAPRAVAEPRERKRFRYPPRKAPAEVAEAKTPETRSVAPQFTAEQLRARIASYISRAKDFRVQGNYGAALAELATARATDPASAEVRAEIEQTKRACIAERKLGRAGLDC